VKVLIIEDDNEIVESISLAFQFYWTEARLLSTHLGKQGVKLAKKESPAVIILDLGLPDIDGIRVLKEIRRFSSVPVLILTVRTYESDVVNTLKEKANDYLSKPFRQLELIKRLKTLAER
jgi:DNA-binding response OmpR family regulator